MYYKNLTSKGNRKDVQNIIYIYSVRKMYVHTEVNRQTYDKFLYKLSYCKYIEL